MAQANPRQVMMISLRRREVPPAGSAPTVSQGAASTEKEQQPAKKSIAEKGKQQEQYSLLLRGAPSTVAGQGLFAARDIDSGSLILSEAPLLTVDDVNTLPRQGEFLDQVRLLSDEQKAALVHLGHHGPVGFTMPDLEKALKLNVSTAAHYVIATFWHSCYPFVKGQSKYDLFEWTSFLNHSCKPNAEARFTPETNRLCVRALEPIKEGREVTISYISPYAEWSVRNARLGFYCRCKACRLIAMAEHEFDARENRLEIFSEGLAALKRYRERWDDPALLEGADQVRGAQEIITALDTEGTLTLTETLIRVAQEEKLWQSELFVLFDVKYLIKIAMSTVTGDGKQRDEALRARGLQLQLLGRCLGLKHPETERAQLVLEKLLEGNEKGLQGLREDIDGLEELGMDETLIRAKQRC
ncbi:hypothetical protein LTR85_001531 [Meristemomyces frigidus]|nr:hypothetical protein LTR85_001531 [Meristemomyces frigidus]